MRNIVTRLRSKMLFIFYELVFGLFTPAKVSCVNFGYAPATTGLADLYPHPEEGCQYELYWQTYAQLARPLEDHEILCEISCGRGGGLAFLRGLTRARLIGLERSFFARRTARKRFGLDVRYAQAPSLPLADQSIDVFLCIDSAHIFHTPQFVRELHRCLKPEGLVLLADQNDGSDGYVRQFLERRYARAGFRLERWRDIRPNVLRALHCEQPRKRQILSALPNIPVMRAKAAAFMSMEGSRKYRELEQGQRTCFIMQARKL